MKTSNGVKTKNNDKEKKEKNSGWKFIAQTFLTETASRIGNNISEKTSELIKNLKKIILGSFLAAIGVIFFLISVAILINAALGDRWLWAGWGAVGVILLAIGYLVAKKK